MFGVVVWVWKYLRPVQVPYVWIIPRRCGIVGWCAVRKCTANQRFLELLKINRIAWLALQIGCNECMKLGELGLRPFLEVSVREVIVPQRKFFLELVLSCVEDKTWGRCWWHDDALGFGYKAQTPGLFGTCGRAFRSHCQAYSIDTPNAGSSRYRFWWTCCWRRERWVEDLLELSLGLMLKLLLRILL